MKDKTEQNQTYIDSITDPTGRKYEGYFDTDSQEYILKYKILNLDDEIRKHSSDIGFDLYDPFSEIKLIHQGSDDI